MFVSKKMTRKLHCVDPSETAKSVHARMVDLNVRHMPVVENGKLVGILSDRDLLLHAWSGLGYGFPEHLIAADIMTKDVVVAPVDIRLADAAQRMVDLKIDALPIVTPDGSMVGIITSTDLLKLVAERARLKELDSDESSSLDEYCWDLPRDVV
jgi:acetoin utilization protein AcuB